MVVSTGVFNTVFEEQPSWRLYKGESTRLDRPFGEVATDLGNKPDQAEDEDWHNVEKSKGDAI